MKYAVRFVLGLLLCLWLTGNAFAAQRMVLCEFAYSEG